MAKYIFGQRIGSGGFGEVLHATREEDGLPFAVKRLLDEHKDDEEIVVRFRREVRLVRSLHHPNILAIVDANLSKSPPWFVMPIAERTLADEIASDLGQERIEELFMKILAGISHAHEQGVIHRDLKPENVMLDHNGDPQISDFGLGKNLLSDSGALTKTYLGAGSLIYGAPEQFVSLRDADGRADIYALGKMLQAMLIGKLPVLTDDPAVPRKYQYFIAKCTAQRPDDRYQTVAEVIVAFDQVVRGVEEPRPARDVAQELIEEWMNTPPDDDLPKLRELHEHFERHSHDQALFHVAVPRMPNALEADYVGRLPNEFKRVLTIYDDHVSGALPFAYCDVVADFYARLYREIQDLEVRRMLLARLIAMGATHNRFHVGDVVVRILTSITETAEVMMAVDVIRADPRNATWFKERLRSATLAEPIDDVLFGEI